MHDVRDVSDIALRRRRARQFGFFIFFLLFIFFLVLSFGWIVLRSGVFWAKTIKISGNSIVSEEQVSSLLKAKIFKDSFGRHVFGYRNMLIWPKELSGDDLRLLPQVKKISINVSYARREIAIQVEERERFGIWCFVLEEGDRSCWWFDHEGFTTERTTGSAGGLILVIQDYSETPKLYGGSYVRSGETFSNLLSVLRFLRGMDAGIEEIAVDKDALEEVRATMAEGPTLYFSLRFPLVGGEAAIASLREKTGFTKLTSVDFRVQNRVYYK
ncbi:MAG: hypothetical protein AAB495_04055 [Patescibacteria group bacterium]